MGNLLEQAAMSLEQKKVKEIFVEDEDFYVDECDCEEVSDAINTILDEAGEIEILGEDFIGAEYIDDNNDILDFVYNLLVELGIESDVIDNYVWETLLADSFLDFFAEDDIVYVSIDEDLFMDWYTTYLEV